MGVAIRTKKPLDLHLAPLVWKQLCCVPLTLEDLEEVDLLYVQTLNSILHIEDSGITEESFHEVNPGQSMFLLVLTSYMHRLEFFCVKLRYSLPLAVWLNHAISMPLLPLAAQPQQCKQLLIDRAGLSCSFPLNFFLPVSVKNQSGKGGLGSPEFNRPGLGTERFGPIFNYSWLSDHVAADQVAGSVLPVLFSLFLFLKIVSLLLLCHICM